MILLDVFFDCLAIMGVVFLSLMLILLGWALCIGDVDSAAIAFSVAVFDGLLLYLYIKYLA